MQLADILKDSNYKLSQFAIAEIEQFEQTITLKPTKSGDVPYTVCLVRQKAIRTIRLIRELLGIAKTGVERAIEKNEEGAIWGYAQATPTLG